MRNFAITLAFALATTLFATYINAIVLDPDTPFAGLGLITVTTFGLVGAIAISTVAGLLLKRDLRVWVAGSQMLLALFFGTLFIPENPIMAKWLLGYGGLLVLAISWATRPPKAAKG